MHGPWPKTCVANCSHHAENTCLDGVPAQARATWNEVGLLQLWEWWYVENADVEKFLHVLRACWVADP